jgi:hypothetical protein
MPLPNINSIVCIESDATAWGKEKWFQKSESKASAQDPLNSAAAASTGKRLLEQLQAPAPTKAVVVQWLYRDPQGNVQGPFASDEMNEWYQDNYFDGSLPVRRSTDTNFLLLSQILALSPEHKLQPFSTPFPPNFPALQNVTPAASTPASAAWPSVSTAPINQQVAPAALTSTQQVVAPVDKTWIVDPLSNQTIKIRAIGDAVAPTATTVNPLVPPSVLPPAVGAVGSHPAPIIQAATQSAQHPQIFQTPQQAPIAHQLPPANPAIAELKERVTAIADQLQHIEAFIRHVCHSCCLNFLISYFLISYFQSTSTPPANPQIVHQVQMAGVQYAELQRQEHFLRQQLNQLTLAEQHAHAQAYAAPWGSNQHVQQQQMFQFQVRTRTKLLFFVILFLYFTIAATTGCAVSDAAATSISTAATTTAAASTTAATRAGACCTAGPSAAKRAGATTAASSRTAIKATTGIAETAGAAKAAGVTNTARVTETTRIAKATGSTALREAAEGAATGGASIAATTTIGATAPTSCRTSNSGNAI